MHWYDTALERHFGQVGPKNFWKFNNRKKSSDNLDNVHDLSQNLLDLSIKDETTGLYKSLLFEKLLIQDDEIPNYNKWLHDSSISDFMYEDNDETINDNNDKPFSEVSEKVDGKKT